MSGNPLRSSNPGDAPASQPAGLEPAVVDFLRETPDVVLFCRDRSGAPIGYPMRTVAVLPDRLCFTTYRKSAKVRNLERDPRTAVLASRWSDADVRWVHVAGIAEIMAPSEDDLDALFGKEDAGTRDPRVPAGMSGHVRQRLREGKRIVVAVGNLSAAGIKASKAP